MSWTVLLRIAWLILLQKDSLLTRSRGSNRVNEWSNRVNKYCMEDVFPLINIDSLRELIYIAFNYHSHTAWLIKYEIIKLYFSL